MPGERNRCGVLDVVTFAVDVSPKSHLKLERDAPGDGRLMLELNQTTCPGRKAGGLEGSKLKKATTPIVFAKIPSHKTIPMNRGLG